LTKHFFRVYEVFDGSLQEPFLLRIWHWQYSDDFWRITWHWRLEWNAVKTINNAVFHLKSLIRCPTHQINTNSTSNNTQSFRAAWH